MRVNILAGLIAGLGNMPIGMNLGWLTTWGGAWPLANLMSSAGRWTRITGSGSYTQDHGLLTASVGTDEFRSTLSDLGGGLPAGTYTVLNPSGCTLAVGNFPTPTAYAAWTNATSFTFAYNGPASGHLALWCRGSLTNGSGNVAVIMPGRAAAFQAGDRWNPEFISFHQALGTRVLRTMDWTNASGNFETDWADRTDGSKPSLRNSLASGAAVMPYEWICDLAGRLNADPWICVPTRATDAYVDALGELINTSLPAGRVAYIEHGNELWNTAYPWGDGTEWIGFRTNQRHTATLTDAANGVFTKAGHGYTHGEAIRCFVTRENLLAVDGSITAIDAQLRTGWRGSIRVIDANTFKINDQAALAGIDQTGLATTHQNVMFIRESEGARSLDANVGAVTLRNCTRLNAAVGRSRLKHILPSQAGATAATAGRVAVAGIPAAVDHIAIAPYYYGDWWGVRVVLASGQITPAAWVNNNRTVHAAVYAAGSTPTDAAVIAGTGAIAKTAITTAGASTFLDGSALTGLTNGTAYRACFVLVSGDYTFQIRLDFTASATASTLYGYDTDANQAFRQQREITSRITDTAAAHAAVAGGISLICYEGGQHYHETAPSQVAAWLETYNEGSTYAGIVTASQVATAAAGFKLACWYADVLGSTFSIADSYADTTDLRYLALTAFNGRVPVRRAVNLSNVLAADITTDPGTFPVTVHDFGTTGITYTLLGASSDWDVSGSAIRMINDAGINWAAPTAQTLRVLASDGYTQDVCTVSFATGDAWYPIDAAFAWSPFDDTDAGAANPAIGGALTLTGTAATPGAGMWDFNAVGRYSGASAMAAGSLTLTKPTLLACVLDKDDHTSTFVDVARIGGATFLSWYFPGSNFAARLYGGANIDTVYSTLAGMPVGKHVYWLFYDPSAANKITIGVDQAVVATNPTAVSTTDMQQTVTIGGTTSASKMKHGSMLAISRTGITQAQALAMVAKMQALHGIA